MRGLVTRKCKQHPTLRFPSSVSLCARHLLPPGRRLLWSRFFIMLGHPCKQSQSAAPASRTQPSPAGQRTAQLDARACAARPRGKARSERRKASFHPDGSGFHLPRGHKTAAPPASFIQLTFTSHAAFFDSFLGSKKESFPRFLLVPSFPRPPALPLVFSLFAG